MKTLIAITILAACLYTGVLKQTIVQVDHERVSYVRCIARAWDASDKTHETPDEASARCKDESSK